MGEKPLSIDEVPVQTATVGGVAPGGGFDAPPPGMAAGGIITTRSNIKSGAATAAAGPPPFDDHGGQTPGGVADEVRSPDMGGAAQGMRLGMETMGAAADRPPPIDGGVGVGVGTEDTPPDVSGAGPTRPGAPGPTDPGDPFPPEPAAELQANGKRGWYRPSAADAEPEAAGVAADGEPIPGLDVKLGRNPPGGVATVGPVKPEPTRPGDPTPTDGGPAGIAIKEQGVRYGEDGGGATPAGDAPGVAAAGRPIPGVDIVIKKNPPR